jgi:tRNA (cmo5U34)-methyltransferase
MSETQRDEVLPEGAWQFDGAVTDVFDDMLARSIPQYDVMRETVTAIACQFLRPRGSVLDLGCSRGGALAQLVERVPHARAVGVDVSEPMLAAARDRFGDRVRIRHCDLRTEFPADLAPYDVVSCVLTLQFTPIEYRQEIVGRIYDSLAPGGALVIVEKVLGASRNLDRTFVDVYYDGKRANGYSDEQIERKRLSLEGVLVPVTAHWNEELFRAAGFREVDCFWRWANFAGWVAVKG